MPRSASRTAGSAPTISSPGKPWRRSGADQRKFGWVRPPWFRLVADEHKAIRERVGLIDMTSFGKIEVHGPGALPLLERAACNLIDRPPGSVVYTQLLNRRGGHRRRRDRDAARR